MVPRLWENCYQNTLGWKNDRNNGISTNRILGPVSSSELADNRDSVHSCWNYGIRLRRRVGLMDRWWSNRALDLDILVSSFQYNLQLRGDVMSTVGMIIIGLIYAVSSYDQFTKGNVGMAMAFAGWSLGQMGMAYAVRN